jgi:2-amino-4-hydroxy-6-hydroxymethyldihydropteridine diphosphokinase
MKHTVYLGLGSNLGDRQAHLRDALDTLPPDVLPLRTSPTYETAPWGYADQGDFLNLVVEAETQLDPLSLLALLKGIEQQVGRQASFRYGPREIDIDILLYDELVFEDEALNIPHPRLLERAFMLKPLSDLNPDFSHPTQGKTIQELLKATGSTGVKLFAAEQLDLETVED